MNTPRPRAIDPRRCRIGLQPDPARPPAPQDDDAPAQQVDRAILCAACSSVVTHHDQRLQVNKRHQHAFFNPAGIAFAVRCFRQAPGATPQGEPSAEFTWFSGHRWQIVLCTACRTHLGWLFTGNQTFFGLIANRLR